MFCTPLPHAEGMTHIQGPRLLLENGWRCCPTANMKEFHKADDYCLCVRHLKPETYYIYFVSLKLFWTPGTSSFSRFLYVELLRKVHERRLIRQPSPSASCLGKLLEALSHSPCTLHVDRHSEVRHHRPVFPLGSRINGHPHFSFQL